MNKYEKWYSNITNRAKTRILDSYSERHHIQPKCLGGSDLPNNLVDLTAREHFVCHWLLVKMYTGQDKHKMLNALRMMRAEKPGQQRYTTNITARVYANLKEEYARLQSRRMLGEKNPMWGRQQTPEAKEKIRSANIGNQITKEQRIKIVLSKKGKKRAPFTEEWKANMSANHRSKRADFDGTISEETRKKIGDKIRGRKQTEEEKARRGAANKGSKREKKLCPHCQKLIAVNTFARWHGPNCKSNPINTR